MSGYGNLRFNVLMANFSQLYFRFTADGLWSTGKGGLTPWGNWNSLPFSLLYVFYPLCTVPLMVSGWWPWYGFRSSNVFGSRKITFVRQVGLSQKLFSWSHLFLWLCCDFEILGMAFVFGCYLCDLIVFWNFGACENLGSESSTFRGAVEGSVVLGWTWWRVREWDCFA